MSRRPNPKYSKRLLSALKRAKGSVAGTALLMGTTVSTVSEAMRCRSLKFIDFRPNNKRRDYWKKRYEEKKAGTWQPTRILPKQDRQKVERKPRPEKSAAAQRRELLKLQPLAKEAQELKRERLIIAAMEKLAALRSGRLSL